LHGKIWGACRLIELERFWKLAAIDQVRDYHGSDWWDISKMKTNNSSMLGWRRK